jgi:uncharacterized protein YlxP (DUF503 family)
VHAAVITFDLHVPSSRSLKAKRSAIRPIVDGIRHRFRLSVAEVGYQDQWQRAEVAVAVVDASEGHAREVLDTVERFVVSRPDVEVLDVTTAWLDAEVAR